MEQGWDPEIKHFFKRIINTISFGLLWLMAGVTGGLYLGLGYRSGRPLYAILIFYVFLIISFVFLLRYYYRIWKK